MKSYLGMAWNFSDVEAAREHLRDFKDMSVVIRANNKPDFDLLTKAKCKMHGMKNVRVLDGTKEPKIYHFD
jgi:hypothetical protein